ncbi:hypothetical protein, partial [Cochleicola gelatinilyticus]
IAITNPTAYPNQSNPQTIYVVVTDSNTMCTAETTFELQVNLPPVLTAPTPLELCDSEEITGPNDEIERFDLTSKRTEITGGNLSVTLQY